MINFVFTLSLKVHAKIYVLGFLEVNYEIMNENIYQNL